MKRKLILPTLIMTILTFQLMGCSAKNESELSGNNSVGLEKESDESSETNESTEETTEAQKTVSNDENKDNAVDQVTGEEPTEIIEAQKLLQYDSDGNAGVDGEIAEGELEAGAYTHQIDDTEQESETDQAVEAYIEVTGVSSSTNKTTSNTKTDTDGGIVVNVDEETGQKLIKKDGKYILDMTGGKGNSTPKQDTSIPQTHGPVVITNPDGTTFITVPENTSLNDSGPEFGSNPNVPEGGFIE